MMMPTGLPEPRMPEGLTHEDVDFSKLYKCVNQGGQKTMCDVVRAMYAHHLAESGRGMMSLQDYLQGSKIKSVFTQIDKKYLDVNLMTEDFDISFAYKMMTKILTEMYKKLSDSCQRQIFYLKSLRNKISHKYGSSGLNVKTEIDELKIVLREIYEGVGKVLNMDFKENIQTMEETFNDIRDAEVRQSDEKSYEQDIEEFRKNSKHNLIVSGYKELVEQYSKFRVLNPFVWLTDPELSVNQFHIDKIFTPLKIEGESQEIMLEDLLTVTKLVRNQPVVPNALILFGLAGSGKTSLCRYILRNWYEKRKEITSGWCEKQKEIKLLENFDLVLLIEVRTVKSRHLIEYLTQQRLRKTSKKFCRDDIIPLLQSLDVLFIIDGFDEANEDSRNVVEEVFAKFPDERILLTTRPEFCDDLSLRSRRHSVHDLHVEVCGFDNDGIIEYTEKVFKEIRPRKDVGEFLRVVRGHNVPKEYLRLPLTLALLIHLWKDDPSRLNKVTSATSLFFEIFEHCQEILKTRICIIAGISDNIRKVLLYVGEQAWSMLQSGNICMSQDIVKKIESKCKSKGIDKKQFMSAFFQYGADEDSDSTEDRYDFIHKTQMEYLAAAFLVDKVKEGGSFDWIMKTHEWRKYREVIEFLTGHLAKEKILGQHRRDIFELIDRAEINTRSYNFWWNFFRESCCNQSVGCIIVKKLPAQHWELDHTQFLSGLKLLTSTQVELLSLKIDIPSNIEPYNISDVFDYMQEMSTELKGRYDKRNAIQVELYFWRHNEYSCDTPSDDFIRTLRPWGHLTNFTGSLGEQAKGKEALAYCFKLKTIRVRLTTLGALTSLRNSLMRIYKNVKKLRITLAFSQNHDPGLLAPLVLNGDLEVVVPNIKNEDKEWLLATVKQVSSSRGCKHLSLLRSEISFTGISWLLRNLPSINVDKVTIETDLDSSDFDKLEQKAKKNGITLNLT